MSDADGQDLPGPLEPAARQDTMPELAGYIVNRLFSVGLSLESARSIAGNGPAGDRIAATDEVDRLIRDIRTALFGLTEDRPALAQERMARTARALQKTALDAVAMLERQADRAGRRRGWITELRSSDGRPLLSRPSRWPDAGNSGRDPTLANLRTRRGPATRADYDPGRQTGGGLTASGAVSLCGSLIRC